MGDGEIDYLGVYLARYQPKRLDDLKPGVLPFIGREGQFSASGYVEDGPYEGQMLMTFPREWDIRDAVWAPACDLEILSGDLSRAV